MDGRSTIHRRTAGSRRRQPTTAGRDCRGWPYADSSRTRGTRGQLYESWSSSRVRDRVRGAKRETHTRRRGVDFFRKPHGPGGAGGRAGYNKTDHRARNQRRIRDAERCASRRSELHRGSLIDDAMREYQSDRESMCCRCTSSPANSRAWSRATEMRQISLDTGQSEGHGAFAQMNAGTISPMAFGAVVGASRGQTVYDPFGSAHYS